ncbi:MAG: ABC transporter ATP-binding protein/permease [Bacillaceae bacterium]|nr:ABC transporter ATP-binding protein/permease [Bacillaceae bacterium]
MKAIFYFLNQIHEYAGKKLYFNMIAITIVSLLDGIGILLLVPMISMTGMVDFQATSSTLSALFVLLQRIPEVIGLPGILSIYVLIVLVHNIVQRKISIQNTEIQHGFFQHLRIKTYDAFLYAKWSFYIKKRKSDLINVLTAEIARASAGTNSFLQFISSLIFTIVQIGLAFWLSPSITFFVLLSGFILIVMNRKFIKKSLELGNTNFNLGKGYLAGITDQINGIKDIKINTLEDSRSKWYQSITGRMKQEQVEYSKMKTKSELYYKVASALLIAVFIYTAIYFFQSHAAQLMLIIVIFSRLWPRVAGIQSSLEQLATSIPAFKSVISIQQESNSEREFTTNNFDDIKPLKVLDGIRCENICFKYAKNTNHYALKNISFFIPTNQLTAIVGKSGAGKSTLIDIIMGLNQPENGELLIDGKLLTNDQLVAWRKAISYVPQDAFLFNDSIRENLKLVMPEATEEEMWSALEFSSAAEFVRELPQGLDTFIGDRGIRLSGGERQRLVLARAILRKPSILVLDEATSALDSENEAKIQQAIENLKGKMTIIVIAHRLSTIRKADQVVVLEQGEIIQKGEFGKLAEQKKGMFSHLLRNQVEAMQ